MKWPWKKHKHSYFFVGRRMFGFLYVFECKTCGQRTEIARNQFWHQRRIGAELLWSAYGS